MRNAECPAEKLSPILVCFAVREEQKPFLKLAGQRAQIQARLTGMGWANAERAIRAALNEQRPDLVLSCGFAGGLNPDLPGGTVLFAADPEAGLEQALLAAGARPGRFHCLDRVATTAKEKQEIRQATGADAVEMESEVIRKVCRAHKIPSATVRVVLDTATEDLPLDFNRLMTPEREMSPVKLAGAILSSPEAIGRLLAFRKQVVAAADALGAVLAQVL